MSDEEYFQKKLDEIPINVLTDAVKILNNKFDELHVKDKIIELHAEYGTDWWIREHHGFGTGVRNILRKAGLTDDVLPDQNWDDYYIQVVEIVCGIRPFPERRL